MKIKQMFVWNWKTSWISLVITMAILLLINIMSGTAFIIFSEGSKEVNVNINTASLLIMPFVVGLVTFGAATRFGGVSGVSRRSVFCGTVLFLLSFSAAIAIGNMSLSMAVSGFPYMGDWEIFDQLIYGSWSAGKPILLRGLGNVAVFSAIGAMVAGLGYFMGGCFYRLGKIGKVIMAAGVPVLVFVIVPIVAILLPDHILGAIAARLAVLGRFLVSSPFKAAIALLPVAILLMALTWALIRRAPITPATGGN